MLLTSLLAATAGLTSNETPRELGLVDWGRRLEPALELAGETSRPVLLLFQEIPG